MICAHFPAGANMDNGDPATLLFFDEEVLQVLARGTQQDLLEGLSEKTS
jgi:hypothetical protein